MGTRTNKLRIVAYINACIFYYQLRETGGGKRDRTADLLHAMQALSQLSYTPVLRLGLSNEEARLCTIFFVCASRIAIF